MDMDTVFLHSDLQPHEQIPFRLIDNMKTAENGTMVTATVAQWAEAVPFVVEGLPRAGMHRVA